MPVTLPANLPTGRTCFHCGNVEFADDEPFGVGLVGDIGSGTGTYVVDCGGCPR